VSGGLELMDSPMDRSMRRLRRSAFGKIVALVSFPWVGSGVLRSLRGRSSQVKGAFGVARDAAPRHPGPASLHGPSGQGLRAGQWPALHHAQHPRTHN
jgi:hypothetical protein